MLDYLKQAFGIGGGSSQLKQTIKVDERNPYARMATHAYNSNYDEIDKDMSNAGYTVDRELSNPNAVVFKKGDEAVVAYRGTKPTNLGDLWTDAHIAVGSRSAKRFDEALELAHRTRGKYKKVKTTGHSLGGTQALYVNEQLGLDAKAFNPGSGLFSGFKADQYSRPNARIIKNPNDLIARNAVHKNTKHVQNKGIKSISWIKRALGHHSIF